MLQRSSRVLVVVVVAVKTNSIQIGLSLRSRTKTPESRGVMQSRRQHVIDEWRLLPVRGSCHLSSSSQVRSAKINHTHIGGYPR